MAFDRYGPIGGLVANRPVTITVTLSFALTALAVAGLADPLSAPRVAATNPLLIITLLAYTTSPFLLAALAPRRLALRLALVGAIWLVLVILPVGIPLQEFADIGYSLEAGVTFSILTTSLVFLGPALGETIRVAFLATASGALGVAGAMGIMETNRVGGDASALIATVAFCLGAFVGVVAASDYALLFARGADPKRAAGVAARYGVASAIYAVILAAAAFSLVGSQADAGSDPLTFAWIGGSGALLVGAVALFATTGALCLRPAIETAAISENRRQHAFRRFWRPIRRRTPPSSAMAFVAILVIVAVAAGFNLSSPVPLVELAFLGAAGGAAGLMFLSVRTGIFVLAVLLTGSLVTTWIWEGLRAPALTQADMLATMAVATALFAQFAVAWRDARSPRLNSSETTEAAMSDALPAYVMNAFIGTAAFFAAQAAGVWESGGEASARLALLALFGLIVGPALMTTLSQ